MLHRLREYDQIEWERASIDSASVPSPPGDSETCPNPTDRGKLGCKHHVIVDQRGLPLVARISGASVHDSYMLQPLLMALPAVTGPAGRPRQHPENFMLTRVMTTGATVSGFAAVGSPRGSPGTVSNQSTPWEVALGWRTNARMAAPFLQAAHSIRTTWRYPSGIPLARSFGYLSAVHCTVLSGGPKHRENTIHEPLCSQVRASVTNI